MRKKSTEDQGLKLRDQLAIAAMQALLAQEKCPTSTNENTQIYAPNGYGTSAGSTYEFCVEDHKSYTNRIQSKMEIICDLAYQIADCMRKSRLKSFT